MGNQKDNCRYCNDTLTEILDLGAQPLANSLLTNQNDSEMIFPLRFCLCESCGLAQVPEHKYTHQDVFLNNYPYRTSINLPYVTQCREWLQDYIGINHPNNVLEVGCNDGYLLESIKHTPHMGLDASDSAVDEARRKGVMAHRSLFPAYWVQEKYDLIIANNVLAHVPNLKEFINGLKIFLTENGTIAIEVPLLDKLIKDVAFDTIYHEHYSYFSLQTLSKIFWEMGLRMKQYDFLDSHGGSVRAYFEHRQPFHKNPPSGIESSIDFSEFSKNVRMLKRIWLNNFSCYGNADQTIACFGASAKGATFLNYLGIKRDMIQHCYDDTPAKQGKFMPGSRIEIRPTDEMEIHRPDILLILPWNFKAEIEKRTEFIKSWGGIHASR